MKTDKQIRRTVSDHTTGPELHILLKESVRQQRT